MPVCTISYCTVVLQAALIMQVLQLSDDQIAMLPPDQRQSILILKEQIARSASKWSVTELSHILVFYMRKNVFVNPGIYLAWKSFSSVPVTEFHVNTCIVLFFTNSVEIVTDKIRLWIRVFPSTLEIYLLKFKYHFSHSNMKDKVAIAKLKVLWRLMAIILGANFVVIHIICKNWLTLNLCFPFVLSWHDLSCVGIHTVMPNKQKTPSPRWRYL